MNRDNPPENTDPSALAGPCPLIFLAEDDIDDQELLIEAVNQYDSTVTFQTATNGKRAVLLLENFPDASLPSLIVLDYNLPELTGAQILEHLSQQQRFLDVPKVVWSTSNSELYKDHCLKLGAKAYFVKPVDLNGIQVLAKEMLAFCR